MLEMYFAITSAVVIMLLCDLFRYSKDSFAQERKAIRRIRRKYIASSVYNNKTYISPGLVSTVSFSRRGCCDDTKKALNHRYVKYTRFFDVG